MKLTADNITDDQIRLLAANFPLVVRGELAAGALGTTEPHRNHSRHEIARLGNGLLCQECTPNDGRVNHVTGHVFVTFGIGWRPCITCRGSGMTRLGESILESSINARAEAPR